ncbi:MAG: hypothetical protein WBB25_04350 [Sulfitobacter sp.]
MPPVFRFYFFHCAIGFGVAGCFTAAILWFNIGNLWHLVSTSDIGAMAITVFWVLNGIVFAGVQVGIAVMSMADRDDDAGPRGGTGVPVPVKAESGVSKRASVNNLTKYSLS